MKRLFSVLGILAMLLCLTPAFAATQDATVAWTAPTLNPASVTGYKIARKVGAAAYVQAYGTTNATTLTFVDPGLLGGTVYCYKITPTSLLGDGPESVEGCSGTLGPPGSTGAPSITITIH